VTDSGLPGELEFYNRNPGDNLPTVRGRVPRPDRRCRVCSLVENLQTENGYTEEEAIDVERHVYHMIHSFWDSYEIADYLRVSVGYQISHDSISNHIAKHIPDPSIAFMERVRGYRPTYMKPRFMKNVTETMRLVLIQFRDDVLHGRVEIKPQDFLKVAEVFKEWSQEMEQDPSEQLMSAVVGALEDLELPDTDVEKFKRSFRERLQEMEEEIE
jgi:hypothetical protein